LHLTEHDGVGRFVDGQAVEVRAGELGGRAAIVVRRRAAVKLGYVRRRTLWRKLALRMS
jgi:hypothetical protein